MEKRNRVSATTYNAPADSATKKVRINSPKSSLPKVVKSLPPKSSPKTPLLKDVPPPMVTATTKSSPPKGSPKTSPIEVSPPKVVASAKGPKLASPPKLATSLKSPPTKVLSPPPASKKSPPKTSPIEVSPPKVVASAKGPKLASPPKLATSVKSPPTKVLPQPQTNNKALMPVTGKYPSPPKRPSSLPPKPRAAEAGQVFIHDITPTTDMSNLTVRGRITAVILAVHAGLNTMLILLNQVTTTIGITIWLREKTAGEVFARMPQEGHVVQISRVTAKKAMYDSAKYHEAALSAGTGICIQIIDDPIALAASPFTYDPILLPSNRSASNSASYSQPPPALNLDSFYEGF